jgi:hypothetical protein
VTGNYDIKREYEVINCNSLEIMISVHGQVAGRKWDGRECIYLLISSYFIIELEKLQC